jgi:hypothetical protein
VGDDQLWVTRQGNGFMALYLTNAWPESEEAGMPSARRCTSRRSFVIHLLAPRGQRLRLARVYVRAEARVGAVASWLHHGPSYPAGMSLRRRYAA